MSPKNETTVLVLSLVVTLALVATGLWWFKNNIGKPGETGSPSNDGVTKLTESKPSNQSVQKRISAGEKVLISSNATPEKQAGVKAIASANYQEAVSKLEASLKSDRNQSVQLVTIKSGKRSGFGYEFVPLPK